MKRRSAFAGSDAVWCSYCGDHRVSWEYNRYGEYSLVDCPKCVRPLHPYFDKPMPERLDGKPVRLYMARDGAVYVDTERVVDASGGLIHRGGPEYPPHYCRYVDYGLTDGQYRCRKCGRIKRREQMTDSELDHLEGV